MVWERMEVGQSWVQENGHAGSDAHPDAIPDAAAANTLPHACVDAAAYTALDTAASPDFLPNAKSNP